MEYLFCFSYFYFNTQYKNKKGKQEISHLSNQGAIETGHVQLIRLI